jgi:uncharacterized protein YjbI with pentapeptide repeats
LSGSLARRSRVLVAILLPSLMLVSALVDPRRTDARGDVTRAGEATTSRPWHHEAEFAQDPALRATPDKVVILHLASALEAGTGFRHRVPYRFDEPGTFAFCIPPHDPHLRDMALVTAFDGTTVAHVDRGGPCQTRTIAAGEYDLLVTRDGTDPASGAGKAFIHVPRQRKVLSENGLAGSLPPACVPPPGAFAVNPNLPYSVLRGPGGRFVTAGSESNFIFTVSASATVADPTDLGSRTGWAICRAPESSVDYSLSNLGDASGEPPLVAFAGTADLGIGHPVLTSAAGTPALLSQTFRLSDLENSQLTLAIRANPSIVPVGVRSDDVLALATSPTPFALGLTYYPTAGRTPVPALQPGEASLSFGDGSTWVLHGSIPDLNAIARGRQPLSSAISQNGCCMKLGPQTVAAFYQLENFLGTTELVVGEDTQFLGGVLARSLRLTPARQFIIATNTCDHCDLSGVDLSGLTLTDGSFRNSSFSGATLTKTVFQGVVLDHADFSGAGTGLTGASFVHSHDRDTSLRCAKFAGVDLTTVTFDALSVGGQLATDFSCRLDLTGAHLRVATFPPRAWRYLDLTDATIDDVTEAPLSTRQAPLDLRGAILTGVNLADVGLDFADLGCATDTHDASPVCTRLTRTTLTKAGLSGAGLVNANLQGATLNFANLTGANLCSAQLNEAPTTKTAASLFGAQLKNANLAKADLSGATLASANFYSSGTAGSCVPVGCTLGACASAAGATLNGTDFTGAYLSGTDLSGSSAQGANFTGALLVGVNLGNVNLSNDPATGTATRFIGAFLQGANFANANVANANFTSAYELPAAGATMVFLLNAEHTAFVDYQPAAGSTAGCVFFTYDHGVTLPVTNGTNTCPNGGPGSGAGGQCSPADWQSPTIPISQAEPPSTSDFSLPQGCVKIDTNW